jgi:hypothetical protein
MRMSFLVLAAALSSGCQTAYVCSNQACQHKKDLESLTASCLKMVEHTAPVAAIVIPDHLPADAQHALALLKPIYTSADAPKSEQWSIPPGYFVLTTLDVGSDEADCAGILGPALQPSATGYADQCGMKFDIPFTVEDGGWASHSYKITECSSTNVIVPKT